MKSSHVKVTEICALVGYLGSGFEVVVQFGEWIKFRLCVIFMDHSLRFKLLVWRAIWFNSGR